MINVPLPPFKLRINLSFGGDSRHCFLFFFEMKLDQHNLAFWWKEHHHSRKESYLKIAKSASISKLSAVKWLEVYGTSLNFT